MLFDTPYSIHTSSTVAHHQSAHQVSSRPSTSGNGPEYVSAATGADDAARATQELQQVTDTRPARLPSAAAGCICDSRKHIRCCTKQYRTLLSACRINANTGHSYTVVVQAKLDCSAHSKTGCNSLHNMKLEQKKKREHRIPLKPLHRSKAVHPSVCHHASQAGK